MVYASRLGLCICNASHKQAWSQRPVMRGLTNREVKTRLVKASVCCCIEHDSAKQFNPLQNLCQCVLLGSKAVRLQHIPKELGSRQPRIAIDELQASPCRCEAEALPITRSLLTWLSFASWPWLYSILPYCQSYR